MPVRLARVRRPIPIWPGEAEAPPVIGTGGSRYEALFSACCSEREDNRPDLRAVERQGLWWEGCIHLFLDDQMPSRVPVLARPSTPCAVKTAILCPRLPGLNNSELKNKISKFRYWAPFLPVVWEAASFLSVSRPHPKAVQLLAVR
jgi:hypothetical protein